MPPVSSATLLAINVISHKGKQLLHGRWVILVNALRDGLQQTGLQNNESTDHLLIYNFNHPYTALSSLLESLEKAKREVGWSEELGAVPIQIVLHLDNPTERYADLYDMAANLWNFLQQESIYITRQLKGHWQKLMEGKQLPAFTIESESDNMFRIAFSETAQLRVERLFPHRGLALSGKEKECFYCGRTNHKPANCPSKLMTMETQGLAEVGYLPFSKISELYKQAFLASEKIISILATGVNVATIKKTPPLQVYLAYFDLFHIFQPRFLNHIAFTFYLKWEDIGRMDRVDIDSNNLNMGLDCLRVGQYDEARKWLTSDNLRRDGKDFYASVGLAFLALEQERDKDMGTLLERANDLAESEKDRIYIGLLLARYYMLNHDLWKADQAANNVLTIHAECPEAKYSKIRISIRSGFMDQAFTQIGTLIKTNKELFITALMDPTLIPIQGLVEEVLSSHVQNLNAMATESLAEVTQEWEQLVAWLGEDDKLIKENSAMVSTLEKHLQRGSYYDLKAVIFRAKSVVAACHRIRREKLDFLQERIDEVFKSWEGYHTFWLQYPYQALFSSFIKKLANLNNNLAELRRQAKKKQNIVFATAIEQLVALHKEIGTLKPQVTRMVWTAEILGSARSFFRKLAISEAVLNVIFFLILALLHTVLANAIPQGLQEIVQDPFTQKKSFLVTTFILAPMLALALTFTEKKPTIAKTRPSRTRESAKR